MFVTVGLTVVLGTVVVKPASVYQIGLPTLQVPDVNVAEVPEQMAAGVAAPVGAVVGV